MFSWPGLLMHYQPRYMYMALPWVIAAFIVLLQSIPIKKQLLKNLFCLCILGYITASSAYVFINMKKREAILHHVDTSLRNLVTKDLPAAGWRQEPLYFFGLPAHWYAMGTAQAIWFLDHAPTNAYPVYQAGPTLYMPHQAHVWAIPRSHTTTVTTTLQDENSGLITLSNNYELRFLESSKDDLNIEFTIPSNFRTRGLWLITWDYAHARFKILGYLPPAWIRDARP